MTEKQQKLTNLLKEFIEIAKKHNLKYSLFYGSLLGAIRHDGFVPWDDDIDLVIPLETYYFLLKYYPEKIKVNENSDNNLHIPKFTNDLENTEDATFLDLFIACKTTKKRINNYFSLKHAIGYLHCYTRRKVFNIQWGMKIAKFFLCWTWLWKKYYLRHALKDLNDDKGDLWFVISWPFKKEKQKNIYQSLDFDKCITHNFENLDVKIISNWEESLLKNYGPNWRIPKKFKGSEHLGLYDMKVFCKKKSNN